LKQFASEELQLRDESFSNLELMLSEVAMLLLRPLIILSTSFELTKEKLKEGCPLNKDQILIMSGPHTCTMLSNRIWKNRAERTRRPLPQIEIFGYVIEIRVKDLSNL